jgi:hypothetical protein
LGLTRFCINSTEPVTPSPGAGAESEVPAIEVPGAPSGDIPVTAEVPGPAASPQSDKDKLNTTTPLPDGSSSVSPTNVTTVAESPTPDPVPSLDDANEAHDDGGPALPPVPQVPAKELSKEESGSPSKPEIPPPPPTLPENSAEPSHPAAPLPVPTAPVEDKELIQEQSGAPNSAAKPEILPEAPVPENPPATVPESAPALPSSQDNEPSNGEANIPDMASKPEIPAPVIPEASIPEAQSTPEHIPATVVEPEPKPTMPEQPANTVEPDGSSSELKPETVLSPLTEPVSPIPITPQESAAADAPKPALLSPQEKEAGKEDSTGNIQLKPEIPQSQVVPGAVAPEIPELQSANVPALGSAPASPEIQATILGETDSFIDAASKPEIQIPPSAPILPESPVPVPETSEPISPQQPSNNMETEASNSDLKPIHPEIQIPESSITPQQTPPVAAEPQPAPAPPQKEEPDLLEASSSELKPETSLPPPATISPVPEIPTSPENVQSHPLRPISAEEPLTAEAETSDSVLKPDVLYPPTPIHPDETLPQRLIKSQAPAVLEPEMVSTEHSELKPEISQTPVLDEAPTPEASLPSEQAPDDALPAPLVTSPEGKEMGAFDSGPKPEINLAPSTPLVLETSVFENGSTLGAIPESVQTPTQEHEQNIQEQESLSLKLEPEPESLSPLSANPSDLVPPLPDANTSSKQQLPPDAVNSEGKELPPTPAPTTTGESLENKPFIDLRAPAPLTDMKPIEIGTQGDSASE